MPRSEQDFRDYVAQSLRDGKSRMDDFDRRILANTSQVAEMSGRIDLTSKKVEENTEVTLAIKQDTAGLVEIFKAGEGTVKFFKMCGTIAKWVGGIAAAAVAIVGFWHLLTEIMHGNWPQK